MRNQSFAKPLVLLGLTWALAACNGGLDTDPHSTGAAAGSTSASGTSGGSAGGSTGGNTGGSTGGTGSTGGGSGTITGGAAGSTAGLINDGTVPTYISNNGTALTGHFTCTQSSQVFGAVTTAVGSNGLVGGPLTTLLNGLGGTTATQLLNSITSPNNVIDGNLDTYASVNLTLGLLGGTLSSEDESVLLPTGTSAGAGNYVVFGISFPKGLTDAQLFNSVTVSTWLNGTQQESNTLNQSALTLLATAGGSSPVAAWVGVQTTKSFDRATIAFTPGVLSASVGDAAHIHELCVNGTLK